MAETWSRCSSCKTDIPYLTTYWVCSVSTCTRKRTGMVFCSVGCWEMHLPMMRHREAFAVEERSPSRQAHLAELAAEKAESTSSPPPTSFTPARSSAPPVVRSSMPAPSSAPPSSAPAVVRRPVAPEPAAAAASAAPTSPMPTPTGDANTDEILVVVSKLKKYIRDRSGMNTSDGVVEALSDHLRHLCDAAVRNAGRDGRKTVMERDFIMLTQAIERR